MNKTGYGRQQGWPLRIKRALDVTVAGGALVALSPALLGVGTFLHLFMGRSVLFRQRRPGLGGRPFELLKFRTMDDQADSSGKPMPDVQRLTRVGRLLRRTSIDELPQLINVLRGEMSLVGPRPLLMRYLERYSEGQMRRHVVLPGITGWAQINGRNATTWDERFARDLWYVDNWSLLLDARILAATIFIFFTGSVFSQPGHESMDEFMG